MKKGILFLGVLSLTLGIYAQEEQSNIKTYTPSKLLNKGEG